jgi:dihydroflavonol-4-reductase
MQPNPEFWRGRPVVVTGGTGFLGWHIVRRLTGLGVRVRVFALPPRPDHPVHGLPGVELMTGDLLDSEAVGRALAGREFVFHTAGVVAVWGRGLTVMDAVHGRGTANVLAAAAANARIVHTSSIVAVGATKEGDVLDEDSPFNLDRLPVRYVQSKRAAEELALAAAAAGRDVVVTNPGYLVGPDDPERSVMGRLCRRFWRGRIPAAPPGGFNLVDVRDVAAGHLLAAEHGVAGRRYILGGKNHFLADFLRLLAIAAGWRPRAVPTVPRWLLAAVAELSELRARFTGKEPYPSRQGARMHRYCWFVRSDRAERELGFEARPLAATLRDTHAWYAADGLGQVSVVNRWWLRAAA